MGTQTDPPPPPSLHRGGGSLSLFLSLSVPSLARVYTRLRLKNKVRLGVELTANALGARRGDEEEGGSGGG